MCEPTTIMAATAVVSTAFTGYQQIQQGRYASDVADYNAAVARNEAEEVRNAGVEAENEQRQKTAQLLSKQRAQLGAANVDLSSGSALALQEDTMVLGEADALRIRSNYLDEADSIDAGAGLTQSQGSAAKQAGYGAAAGTLLSGTSAVVGSGVADKWFTPDSAAMSASAKMGQSVTGTSTIPSF